MEGAECQPIVAFVISHPSRSVGEPKLAHLQYFEIQTASKNRHRLS